MRFRDSTQILLTTSASFLSAGYGNSCAVQDGVLPAGGKQNRVGGAGEVTRLKADLLVCPSQAAALVSSGHSWLCWAPLHCVSGWGSTKNLPSTLIVYEKSKTHSAWDRRTGTQVAIKKLHRPFQSRLFAKRAYRELRLLKHMKHENVIGLLDVFTAEISLDRFRDFYLVMPFMGTDLGKLMKMERLSEDRIQFLVYQMLRGLKYIHSAGIIHRDLKPGNLAINPDCELKILDFGLARQADTEMTGYVVTRWYRAPEVILNWMHYTQTVDIWSAGCIMAEMLLGKPLFKGNDHLDQLREIMKITGTPTPDFVLKLQSQDARNYIRSLPKVPKKDLLSIFSKASSNAVYVLEKMLLLDPDSRASASEALELPFFSEFRDVEEETEALPYDQTMDNTDLPLDQWKRHTFTEILTFRPPRDSKQTSL
ncbi:mitogen-activated protein kinase 12-like [Anableps anableps]